MQISSKKHLWSRSVISGNVFTRNRCLPFQTLVLLILNLPKRSLNIEINSFFAHIQQKSCSKAAFCRQRSKLKPYFFKLWNNVLIKSFYHHYGDRVKRWKGFILVAFDGCVISLPNTKELATVYGRTSNQNGQHGVASHSSVMYDVLNKLVLDGRLYPYLTVESSVVIKHLKQAPANSLLTFDRGYPRYWLFYLLSEQLQYKFVMRASSHFNNVVKTFLHSSEQDCIKPFYPEGKAIKHLQTLGISIDKQTALYLRMVKVPLKTGKTEVLITNLYSDQCFSIQDLGEVYALRWGIETCFGILKNQLQIEAFSGTRRLCVEQDYFANLLVYNLQSIIEKQSEQTVVVVSKNRKHNYQINKNLSWAVLKNRMVDLFLKEKPQQILLELQALFEQYLEPVRPNRTYPRNRKSIHQNGKYKTLTNYKRVI